MSGDIGCVPREQEHESRAKCAGQKGGSEKSGFVCRNAIGVEADHEASAENGGQDTDEHDHGSVVPFVGEVADCKDTDGSDGAAGSVEDESLLGGVSKGCEKDAAKIA